MAEKEERFKKRDRVFNVNWHTAKINELIDEQNDTIEEMDRLKRLVLQVGGIPAEYFDKNNILDEDVARAYNVDPYGRKR